MGFMLSAQMREFRQLVFARPELREALRGCDSESQLVTASVALASQHGIALSEDEVRLALNAGQREWIERWI